MELLTFTNLQQVLEEYAEKAEEIYKYQIALGGHNASRNLVDSIRTHVVIDDRGFEVTMDLAYYWKYLEGGSKGMESSPDGAVYPAHFPPPRVLEQWINVKPVIPRPMADGRIPSPRQLSWMIARKIQREGIEPYPAVQTTIEELNRMYEGKFAIALQKDTADYIARIYVGLDFGALSQRIR